MITALNERFYLSHEEETILHDLGIQDPCRDCIPDRIILLIRKAALLAGTPARRKQYQHLYDMLMFDARQHGWESSTYATIISRLCTA